MGTGSRVIHLLSAQPVALFNSAVRRVTFSKSSDAAPEFKIKPTKEEKEIKLLAPHSLIGNDERAAQFFRELVGGGSGALAPTVTHRVKKRAIVDTDDLFIMHQLGGFLTLTYEHDGKTKQRFKDRVEPEESGLLIRAERTAKIYAPVAHPVYEAIKSEKLRNALRARDGDMKVQGMMHYVSDEAAVVIDGCVVNVSLDRGHIHSRFKEIAPIPFCELELDSHEEAGPVIEAAQRIRASQGFAISTTPKEEWLLANSEMIVRLQKETRQSLRNARQEKFYGHANANFVEQHLA